MTPSYNECIQWQIKARALRAAARKGALNCCFFQNFGLKALILEILYLTKMLKSITISEKGHGSIPFEN